MIIKSQQQLQKKDSDDLYDRNKLISKFKIHPSLIQEYKEPNDFNFLRKRSFELKINSIQRSYENLNQKHTKSNFYLRPIKSRSSSKKLENRTEMSERKQSRSDRKLLIIKNDPIIYQKDRNLKDLLSYDKKIENSTKINKIINAFSQIEANDCQSKDVQQKFYEEVRILQQFKQQNKMVN